MSTRKISFIAVVALLIVLTVGYDIFWHKKAEDFKQMLAQSIEALNTQEKPLTKGAPLLHYESLQATGFPFSMTIHVVKPVVRLPMTDLLHALREPSSAVNAAPAVTSPAAPAANWIEEIGYGESVAFSGNITGNHFTLTASGDRTHTTFLNDKMTRRLVGSSAGPLVCHLTVEKDGAALWTMRPIFTDLQTFLSIFRAGDCKIQEVALKDSASGALLFSADALAGGLSNEAMSATEHRIVLTSEYKNAKATPAIDPIVNDYAQLTNLAMYKSPQPATVIIPLSTYGTMNTRIDIRYEGPTQEKQMADPQARMHFDINAFDVSDALAESTFEAHIATGPTGADRVASIKIKGRSEVSDQFDKIMPGYLTGLLTQIEQDTSTVQTQQMGQNLASLGNPQDVVAAMLPKLRPFGKMELDIDASAKGPNDKPNAFLTKGVVKLDALNLVTEPYGVRINGNADMSKSGKTPSAELVLKCQNCDALVGDLGNYILRVETLAGNLHQPPKPPSFHPDLIDGVKQFLHAISENSTDANAKDLTIHFVMKDNGEILVSGKPMMEVAGVFGSTIGPHLTIQFPPAAGKEAPPASPGK